ncbi:hypothetical protein [Bergeyella zoohelcum]|uniref:hypothetical protein n=1 Tax=Bergeyella zoohelcum TaxID=1015 RepID=UPI000F63A18B|nr:hypothetical protein [Bergeyella zoohelcum]
MKRTKTLSAISFTAYDVEKTLRWTPAVQNVTHRDVEQPLGCQGRRTCKRQSIGNEILRYAAGRLCPEL